MGFFGIDPRQPCPDPPGSTLKTAYMACRYAKGMPMDHPDDANYETAASPLPALGDAEEVFDELDQVEA